MYKVRVCVWRTPARPRSSARRVDRRRAHYSRLRTARASLRARSSRHSRLTRALSLPSLALAHPAQLTRAPRGDVAEDGSELPDPTLLMSNLVALAGFVTKIEALSLAAVFLAVSVACRKGLAADPKNLILALSLSVMGVGSTIFQEGVNKARGALQLQQQ